MDEEVMGFSGKNQGVSEVAELSLDIPGLAEKKLVTTRRVSSC
jgi:hypothetical protein